MSRMTAYAYAGVVLTMFFWGSTFNATSYIIHYLPPLSAAAERFVVASLSLLLILSVLGKLKLSTLRQNAVIFMIVGLLAVVGFNTGFFFGLQTTSAVNGALIMATTPLTTLLLSAVLDGEKFTPNKTLGVILGLAGVLLVISHGNLIALLHLKVAIGDLYILAGGTAFCLANVLSRRFVKNSTPLETTTFSMLFGALGLSLLSLVFEHPVTAVIHAPITAQLAMLYVIICSTMIAYLLWFNGLQKLGAGRASIFFNLVPVFSMLVAVAMGQLPNIWQLIGTLLVIAGVMSSSGFINFSKHAVVVNKSY